MSSYTKETTNGTTTFLIQPQILPFSWGAWSLLFFASLLSLVFSKILSISLLIIGTFLIYSMKAKSRHPHSFSADASGIEISGTKINNDEIHRLIIRNPISNIERPYPVNNALIVTFGGFAGVAQATAGQFSNGFKQYTATVARANLAVHEKYSYEVHVEAGGQATRIAYGVDETCAFGLMQDAIKALQNTKTDSAMAS